MPGLGIVGRPFKRREGILIATGLVEDLTETQPRRRKVGLERQRPLEAGRGFAGPALPVSQIAKSAVRLGVAGGDGERLLVVSRCVLEPAALRAARLSMT